MVRRSFALNLFFILVGVLVAVLWVSLTGSRQLLSEITQADPVYLLPLLSITVFFIFMRFIRWHFLLRRVSIRVPTRPSLSLFLASLAGTATPAYFGELIRSIFMRRKFGTPVRTTVWVQVVERLYDIAALGFIGVFTATDGWGAAWMAAFVAGAAALIVVAGSMAKRAGVDEKAVRDVLLGKTWMQALGLSLVIWLPASWMISIAGAGLDITIPFVTGMNVYSRSTLLGGLTLSPAGIGATGSLAILQLQEFGLSLAHSVSVTTLVRLTSTGLALTTGAVFLVYEWAALRNQRKESEPLHFDQIATEYRKQFKDHIWNHLLDRKSTLITEALSGHPSAKGLDLGCGLGFQCLEMIRRGYPVIGTDIALNLIQRARKAGAVVANSDALAMPFADNSFDYIYTIGVIHHLPGPIMQQAVYQEVMRVLKPGGLFIIHETNPRNPLFRFYMGYIFPILRSIDEGIEWWIDPQLWGKLEGFRLVGVKYFTFMPDFIPQFLLQPFHAFEDRMEGSRMKIFSVHYMAVIQKCVDQPGFAVPEMKEPLWVGANQRVTGNSPAN